MLFFKTLSLFATQIFTFFNNYGKQENKHEYERRKNMTYEERLREFTILQERRWGAQWTSQPIEKKVTFEKLFCKNHHPVR
jgi:hypothetical protein